MTSELEKREAEMLRLQIDHEKKSCWSYLKTLCYASGEQLAQFGYGGFSNAQAMQDAFARSEKTIDKLVAAHVKKWPD